MKVNLSGLALAVVLLTQFNSTNSFAQLDPRNVFIASTAVKGKAILEYDAQGVQVFNINIKDTTAQQFLSCNWGSDLLPIASLSLEPSVNLTLNNLAGKAVKQLKLGVVGSVVSLIAADIDGNGLCDLLSFDKNGSGTLYPDTAIDGSPRDFVKLPPRYNYALLLKNHTIAGFVSFGKGASITVTKKKKVKKQVKNPPITLTMSSITGETISTIKLPRGVKGILPLDYSPSPAFAVIKETAISIINESGVASATIKIAKGSEVLARDIQKLGYLQLIVSGDSSFTIFDPALGTNIQSMLGAAPIQTPGPSPTPSDGGGSGGSNNNYDPTHPGSGFAACNALADYVQYLIEQGRDAEAQALLPKLIQICTDAINSGPIGGSPDTTYGAPYLPPGQGQMYIRSILHPKDGASDAVGPCSVMLNPFDGFKQGLTIKNSDTRPGTMALLFPGGKEAYNGRIIDAKKFKILARLQDYGFAFPDNRGARHLYRTKGQVNGLGGKILVSETNGLIECWKLPGGKNRID